MEPVKPPTVRLFRDSPAFRALVLSRMISFVGDGVALVALVLYVQGSRGTGRSVAGLLLAEAVPSLIGPVAGTLADRMDRRRLMMVCELGQGAIYVAIAAWLPGYAVLLAMVAAATTLARTFGPAGRSALPAIVGPDDLGGANAWLGTALNLQVALGSLGGGLLVAGVGIRGALLVDAGTFLVSAVLLTRLPTLRPHRQEEAHRGFLADIGDGLRFAARHRVARAVVVTLLLGVAFAGVDNVALVFLVRDDLDAGAAGYGVVAAAWGVGMLAISLSLIRWSRRIGPRFAYLGGWLSCGIGLVGTGLSPSLGPVATAQLIGGLGNGATNIGGDTMIQRTVSAGTLGRVFGLTATAAFLGGGLAYAAGGLLVDATSPRTAFLIGGAGVLVAFALGSPCCPRRPGPSSPESRAGALPCPHDRRAVCT